MSDDPGRPTVTERLGFRRAVFEHIQDAVLVVADGGRLVDANPAALALTGLTRSELLGSRLSGLVRPAERTVIERLAAELVAQGESRGELVLTRPDGSRVVTEHRAIADFVPGADLWVLRDVSRRRRLEGELRASEGRYRLLFDENPQPMWVYELDTLRFLAVNRAAIEHYGFTRDEFLSMSLEDLRPEEELPALLETLRSLGPGPQYSGVWRHSTKDGSVIDVEIYSQSVGFDGQEARLVLVVDVTERRHLEQQLRQAQKMEAVGRLAGGIAHDFNNILTTIVGYCDLLGQELHDGDSKSRHVVQIQRAAERATSLTQQLLAFSRRQVLQPRVLDLNRVVRDMEEMLHRLLGEDVLLVTRLGADLRPVEADVGGLEQTIVNLAVNARDAMPGGGELTLETSSLNVELPVRRGMARVSAGRYSVLTVSDTGTGIAGEDQARVFEPFFTTKEAGKGTGLGLSTVYGIVKQSGGYIWVESEPGRGATFRIYLPAVDHPVSADEGRKGAVEVLQASGTILLAEDDTELRMLVREVLRDRGFEVLEASDGGEALKIVEGYDGSIDLLLSDVVMPDMRGPALYAELRRRFPALKALFISGYPREVASQEQLLDSRAAFLSKPFRPDALVDEVRRVLVGS